MKHAYIVHLYYSGYHFNMPYIFTNEKEAYLYGEYEFRTNPDLTYYKVEKVRKLETRFYALKE